MIQANELRVGNWLIFYGKFEKVESIGTYGVSFDDGFAKYTLPNLKPIPLTEEILLKCGFEKIENNWKVLTYHGVFYFSWERLAGSAFSLEKESIYLPHIKHLHQLQNLYHALTGQELEIEL